MARTCFDNSIWHQPEFLALSPSIRAALPPIVSAISERGDGKLNDDLLRAVGGLGRKRMAVLCAALIDAGWFRRAPNGCIVRAGILSPDTIQKRDQRHQDGARPDDSMLLDLRRELAEIRRENREFREMVAAHNPGWGIVVDAAESPDNPPTNPGQTNGQMPDSREAPRAGAEDSLSLDSDSLSLDARERAEKLGCGKVYDLLRKNGIPDQYILEALAVSWDQKGGETPNAGRYVLNIARNRKAAAECSTDAQEALAILIPVAGGQKDAGSAATPRASPNRRANGKTLADAAESSIADLEEKYANGELICQTSTGR